MDAIVRRQQCVHHRCNVRSRCGIGKLEAGQLRYYVNFKAGIFLVLILGSTIALPTPITPNAKQTEPPINSLSSSWDHVKAGTFAAHLPGSNSSIMGQTEQKEKNKVTTNAGSRYNDSVHNNGPLSLDSDAVATKDLRTVRDNTTAFVPSDAEDNTSKGPKVNLAVLLLLGVLCVLTFACIKCCNWFKSHVKEREYVEDGKFVFPVEDGKFVFPVEDGKFVFPVECDLDQDHLLSTGTAYNPYETVTSSTYNPYSTVTSSTYNPYSTVTSMISDISNVEKRDASTWVKPKDIWKTMRSVRGMSVPDPEELEREGEFLGNVVEEVKKLKNCLMKQGDSPSPSPSENKDILRENPPGLPSTLKSVDSSEEDLLEEREPSIVVAEVEHHHSRSGQRPALNSQMMELCTPLLEPHAPSQGKTPHRKGTSRQKGTSRHHKRRNTVDLSIQCVNTIEATGDRGSPNGRHRSISVSASSGAGLEDPPGKVMRSRLRSPGRKRNISVSFEDEVVHIVDPASEPEKKHRGSDKNKKRSISPTKISTTGGIVSSLPPSTIKNLEQSVDMVMTPVINDTVCEFSNEPKVSKCENELPDGNGPEVLNAEYDEDTSSCGGSSSSKVSCESMSSGSVGHKICSLSCEHTSDLRLNDLAKRDDIILPDFQPSLSTNLVSNDMRAIESGDCVGLPPLSLMNATHLSYHSVNELAVS